MHHFQIFWRTVSLLFAFTFVVAPTSAVAGDDAPQTALTPSANVYIELRGSARFLDDTSNTGNAPAVLRGTRDFDTGFGLSTALGSDLSRFFSPSFKSLRAEIELSYYENDLAGVAFNPEVSATAYMANLVYDLQPISGIPKLTPYVGVGIGASTVEIEGTSLRSDESTEFAYQVRVGLGYQLRPTLDLSLGYHFFDVMDPTFRSVSGEFDTEFRSHAVEAGLRYRF